MSVHRLLTEMSSHELTEWSIFLEADHARAEAERQGQMMERDLDH